MAPKAIWVRAGSPLGLGRCDPDGRDTKEGAETIYHPVLFVFCEYARSSGFCRLAGFLGLWAAFFRRLWSTVDWRLATGDWRLATGDFWIQGADPDT